ncbi:methylmalonyl Co-A mutase-associated GTPase MeaB [Acidaminobacter sp. JC074]|uniref:methylmalonyl Co-A mutase-associated GTPase MeaB n=1 Tax=Acidaminobacter sp. JC074 TaxID=2530199 RepID=UPI001F0D5BCB|nr:methylmalonyl Co-A mutase-associated GTPase MeaB [Acidaminobacter sp. JC074]MCH4886555.1 methylmalonyl Co-A mutase-associated GTPase MeaB [Acidaminobacter sp. JC074]
MTSKKPKWVPEHADGEFATKVMDGVEKGHTSKKRLVRKRKELSIDDYYSGILEGNRMILARSITLIESNALRHFDMSQTLLQQLLPHTGKAIRIGISGVPGAGKSTLIEAFGLYLCNLGLKVAVLAVDPSSSITGGSILGDKTRMEQLSRHDNAFIRPSPSGGTLGGVTRKSKETILLCEAAGYDVILVETVGVGQNEVTVRSMVDFFLLVLITGGGDDLQGMKKGVMEICDAILVNKADGDNLVRAKAAQGEFKTILTYLRPATDGWQSRVLICSALYNEGVSDIWDMIQEFLVITKENGVFESRRQAQTLEWVFNTVIHQLTSRFYNHDGVKRMIPKLKTSLANGQVSPTRAAMELLEVFDKK